MYFIGKKRSKKNPLTPVLALCEAGLALQTIIAHQPLKTIKVQNVTDNQYVY